MNTQSDNPQDRPKRNSELFFYTMTDRYPYKPKHMLDNPPPRPLPKVGITDA